jgi:type I restriction enzyme S subunit
MELKPGYKQTEVGVIPEEWHTIPLEEITTHIGDGLHGTPVYSPNGSFFFINGNNLQGGKIFVTSDTKAVDHSEFIIHRKPLNHRSILMSINGTIGNLALFDGEAIVLGKSAAYLNVKKDISRSYVYHCLNTEIVRRQFFDGLTGSTIGNLGLATIRCTRIPLPPTKAEQRAIAAALGDVDVLLSALERLIAKKRDLKQADMQELLTGKTRLPGFHGQWEEKTLEQSAYCLDSVRVPLNESQRAVMKGDYPYCGANGVLDYVNGYVIDDDIILMAEDGGYFDEYQTRPIAYRMSGKCWVNNHAHILKANAGFEQGYLFYSLVHKNILPFLASGTRAKLNKFEMNRIEVRFPKDETEQIAIAAVLSDMDAELTALEQRRDKTRALKQAMMQELLTGKTRISPTGGPHA